MFARPRSIKLLEIAGIRVGVDGTWFVMLFLLVFLLSGSFRNVLGTSETTAYVTTVITVMLFFASLLAHELGHAFAARRRGIAVDRIELFLFGGTTFMGRDAESPREELQIALAGPLGTLVVIAVCLIVDLVLVGPHRLVQAAELNNGITITPVLLSLSWLLLMNVAIFIFNLIPAYPLDGGRVARAVVWKLRGDQLQGTRVAAQLGRAFSIILGIVGLVVAVRGSAFGGIWLLLLAVMLYQSAAAALRGTAITARIQTVHVADIMDGDPITLTSTLPLSEALDEYFRRYEQPWLPVVDADGCFAGIARRYRVEEGVRGDAEDPVQTITETDQRSELEIRTDQPLTDVLRFEALGQMGALVAVDAAGVVRGTLTPGDVNRAMQQLFGGR
jgi:Zn-dependent protease